MRREPIPEPVPPPRAWTVHTYFMFRYKFINNKYNNHNNRNKNNNDDNNNDTPLLIYQY